MQVAKRPNLTLDFDSTSEQFFPLWATPKVQVIYIFFENKGSESYKKKVTRQFLKATGV